MIHMLKKGCRRAAVLSLALIFVMTSLSLPAVPVRAAGAPYGDGGYRYEPPEGPVITDLFDLVQKNGTSTRVDTQYKNVAIVTGDLQNQRGALWSKTKLDLTLPFKTEMYLHLGHTVGKEGTTLADGMTFTMHNDTNGKSAIGGLGEGIGAFVGRNSSGLTDSSTCIKKALSIELDTYFNEYDGSNYPDRVDPNSSQYSAHCALIIPNNGWAHLAEHIQSWYWFFEPTQEWTRFEVEWIPEINGSTVGGTLIYSFGGVEKSYGITDVTTIFGSKEVYWGFTGSTGMHSALQAAAITKLPTQEFSVEKSAKDSNGMDIDGDVAKAGDIITYTVSVKENKVIAGIGPVIMEDVLSPYVRYIDGSLTVATKSGSTPSVTPSYENGKLTVATNHTLLTVGDWITFSFNVEVLVDGIGDIVRNTAVAKATEISDQVSNTTEFAVIVSSKKTIAADSAAGTNGEAVKPGDEVTFEIDYFNPTGKVADLTITDPIPTSAEYAECTGGGIFDINTNRVTWQITGIPAGGTGSVTVTMRVTDQAGSVISNKANLSWTPESGASKTEDPEAEVPVASYKTVAADSTAGIGGKPVKPGDLVTFKIAYSNQTGEAADLKIIDAIPMGMEYVRHTGDGVYDDTGKKVTWEISDIPDSGGGYVTVTMRVTAAARVSITNIAQLSWTPLEGGAPQVENPDAEILVGSYKIIDADSIAGTDGSPVKEGDLVTYEIGYVNHTGKNANLTITDVIPAGMEYISNTGGGSYAGGSVVWAIPNVLAKDGGSVTVTMKVTAAASDADVIKNMAKLSWVTGDDLREENPEVDVPAGWPYKIVADDSAAGAAGAPVKPGDRVTFEIGYFNPTSAAVNLIITDSIPDGMAFVSATDEDGIDLDGTEYDSQSGIVTWPAINVPVGESGVVTITMDVTAAAANLSVINNKATLSWDDSGTPDDNPEVDVPVGWSYKIVSDGSAAGKDGRPVKPGDEVTFEIHYVNPLGEVADLTITDPIPAGMAFVSASPGGSEQGGVVTWLKDGISADEEGVVTVTMRVTEAADTSITNRAHLLWVPVSGGTDKEEEPEVEVPVGWSYKIVDESSVDGVGSKPVKEGDLVTFEIGYVNPTGKSANLTITDVIPAGMEFLSATDENNAPMNGDEHASGVVTWPTITVPANGSGSVTVTMKVTATAGSVAVIANTANLKWVTEGDPGDPEEEEPGNELQVGSYKIIDDESMAGAGGKSVKEGDEVTFRIGYVNPLSGTAYLMITDPIPAGMKFVRASDGGVEQGGMVNWPEITVPGDGSGYVNVTMRVTAEAKDSITNIAKLAWAATSGGEPQETERPKAEVPVGSYKMVSDSSADGSPVAEGDLVTFEIGYVNHTGKTANLTIIDEIPQGMAYEGNTGGGQYDSATGAVIWTFPDVLDGGGGRVTVTMCVTAEARTSVTNKATLRWVANEEEPTVEEPEAKIPVGSHKVVADESTAGADGNPVKSGDEVTFEIGYINHTGKNAALTITDVVPVGMEFVSATDESGTLMGGSEHASGLVTWPTITVPVGGSGRVTVTMRVTSLAESVITNQANLKWAPDGGDQEEEAPKVDIPVVYTITYDANGGDGGYVDADIAAGTSYTILSRTEANVSRPGYTFTGWNTKADGKGTAYSVGAAITITSDVYLYAQWKSSSGGGGSDPDPTSYNVTYNANGGSGSYRDTDITAGSEYTVLSQGNTGINHDSFFTGWNTKADGSGTAYAPGSSLTVNSNVTLYAQWTLEGIYTVIYNPNGGSGTQYSVTELVGDVHTVLANNLNFKFTRGGYTFRGWSMVSTASTATYFGTGGESIGNKAEPGDTITLYAVWSRLTNPIDPDVSIEDMAPPLGYLDFSNHFAYIIGYPDGYARPESNITRAEVTTIFFRLLTQWNRAELWATANDYPDATADNWFNNAISTLTNGGVVKGYSDGTFRPDGAITRAEFAAIAVRFANAEDILNATGTAAFSDISGHWAENHIALAGALGYVQGYGDGTFCPDEFITRAEVVALLDNVLNRHVESEEVMLATMMTWPDNTPDKWHYFEMQEATNSHFYSRNEDGRTEQWTELRSVPDWKLLEQPDSLPEMVSY